MSKSLSRLLSLYKNLDNEIKKEKKNIIKLEKYKQKLEKEIFNILSYINIYIYIFNKNSKYNYTALIDYSNGKTTIINKELNIDGIDETIISNLILDTIKHTIFNKYINIFMIEEQKNILLNSQIDKNILDKLNANNINIFSIKSNDTNIIACMRICENNFKQEQK